MAWVTPPTFVDGDLAATDLNILRDDIIDLHDRMVLHGMPSSSSLGQIVGARYAVKLTRSSQTIPTATDQLIYWDTEVFDDDGLWTPSSSARVVIKEDGTYVVKAWGKYEANGTGAMRGLELFIDGVNYAEDRKAPTGASFQCSVRSEDEFALSAGAEIKVRARHNATSAIDLTEASLVVRRVAKTA